jgi:hypothetical protein
MALNVGLDASFDKMYGWKGIQGRAGKLMTELMNFPVEVPTTVTLVP